jgi:hypothetical protein
MKTLRVLGLAFLLCANSYAVTSQFRGVNWADKRDNFVSDVLVLSGLSLSDNHESAYAIADRIVGQFQEVLGTNSVRMPVNEPTILKAFDMYSGALDAALEHGRVAMGYWGPAQPAGPKNMDDWWKMWAKIVEHYGDHPNAYFEIFNEPHMYSKDELRNLYATWLEKFPDVPRDHILLDGSGLAWNVPDIADDPRFEGCLFAVHEYTFWNMSITTEQGWKNSFKGKVGKYIDRTVCTEWGGAMSPGEKAGVHYDYMDYNSTPTNYFMAYIRGMSDQLREWEMGSFYWPGLRDGDWYSMTKRSGEGVNTKLEIVNQSGVDRMQMAWADTVETNPPKQDPFGKIGEDGAAVAGTPLAIPGKFEAENYDLGGNRVSFYDKSSANEGGFYRKDAVDIVALDSADLSKGYALGYTQDGEWLEYTVNVAKTAKYAVELQMATASEKAGVQFFVDGKAISDSIIAKQGEDWSTYSAVQSKVGELSAGEHVLKMQIVGNYVNIDNIRFCEGEKCEETVGIRASRASLSAGTLENASPRLRVQNNKLYIEKNGKRFDLTGHRIK